MMELRKCCNHPFLIKGVEQSNAAGPKSQDVIQRAITASGKLILIDKMLPRLRREGHKVLIFSQMVRVLDILEDFLRYRQYNYERIDGGVRGNDRQAAIDRFSKPGLPPWRFLPGVRTVRSLGVVACRFGSIRLPPLHQSWRAGDKSYRCRHCHHLRLGLEPAERHPGDGTSASHWADDGCQDIPTAHTQHVHALLRRIAVSLAVPHASAFPCRYERQMFERASRKLGLEQAVLTNITSTGGATAEPTGDGEAQPSTVASSKQMDSTEIDRLLKFGAYDLFHAESDETAIRQFEDEDIDFILERRATKVVHSSEGATVFGNTFSKATFATAENPKDIVDVADPNYWEKVMPKRPAKAHNSLIGQTQPRQRKQTEFLGKKDEDSDEFSDSGTKEKGGWSIKERKAATTFLKQMGYGRWKLMCRDELERKSLDEVVKFAKDYVTVCAERVGPASASMRIVKVAEDTQINDQRLQTQPPEKSLVADKKLTEGSAKIALEAMESNYTLKLACEKSPSFRVPPLQGKKVFPSWSDSYDRTVLLGMFKHGRDAIEVICRDAELWSALNAASAMEALDKEQQADVRRRAHKLLKIMEKMSDQQLLEVKKEKPTKKAAATAKSDEEDLRKYVMTFGWKAIDEHILQHIKAAVPSLPSAAADVEKVVQDFIATQKALALESSSPSSKKAKLTIERLALITKLRRVTGDLSEEGIATALSAVDGFSSSGLPEWWKFPDHSITFLNHIAVHGIASWEKLQLVSGADLTAHAVPDSKVLLKHVSSLVDMLGNDGAVKPARAHLTPRGAIQW